MKQETLPRVGLVGVGRWGTILKSKIPAFGTLEWAGGRDLLPLPETLTAKEEVDWVVVATPSPTHAKLTSQALGHLS